MAQSGSVELLDVRLPSQVAKDNQAALDLFKTKAAPFYQAIRTGAEHYGDVLRYELNALSGGQAPASVMALAQAAIDAHANCQLAQHILGHATGDLEKLPTSKQAGRRLEITQLQRTAMGLDVAFTDLVRRATEAAKEVKRSNEGSATAGLMARLGVGPARDAQASSPFSPPGGLSLGPPSPSTVAPEPILSTPNSQEPE